ncbi:MAG: SlyX family protein [Planctomycetota bacterium]|jgi:uncharacterized coiled-coil protein SlyX
MSERITAVEEKLAFLERHLEQLDEVVRGMRDEHDALERRIDGLQQRVERAPTPPPDDEADDDLPAG